MGFGRHTTGGKDGPIYKVTDSSDDNVEEPKPGTLRHAVIQKHPLWIIFAKSMTITLQQELLMQCDKTIDGRGKNVKISGGAGISIQFVRNIIIHNIHITDIHVTSGGSIRDSIDHIGLRAAADGDAISIFGSSDIWIDHVSASNAKDGLIDIVANSNGVTISNCHFVHHDKVGTLEHLQRRFVKWLAIIISYIDNINFLLKTCAPDFTYLLNMSIR